MNTNLVLDLHLHSRFSQAVSKYINLSTLSEWGKKKGIDVMSASDITHPVWFEEIKEQLHEVEEGIYSIHNTVNEEKYPVFLLSTEVCLIYTDFGKGRRVHILIFFPNISVAQKVNKKLVSQGFNISSDGRPILGLSLRKLCDLLFSIDESIMLIPAHVWTPWFGLYGSKSGYDSLEQAFGEYADSIFAVESGLSSDPVMNWQIEELQSRSIVSFSDAHSLSKIGREATVLSLRENNGVRKTKESIRKQITYSSLMNGMKKDSDSLFKIAYTVEYYPEEGKYHYTGHRNCGVMFSPEQTKEQGTVCPVCGRLLTVGVLHRISELSGSNRISFTQKKDARGVVWDHNDTYGRFFHMVPLLEILSESYGVGIQTKKVQGAYDMLLKNLGSEMHILLSSSLAEIQRVSNEKVAKAVQKVRLRDISIQPGYDGKYGTVSIWADDDSVPSEQLKIL